VRTSLLRPPWTRQGSRNDRASLGDQGSQASVALAVAALVRCKRSDILQQCERGAYRVKVPVETICVDSGENAVEAAGARL